MSGSIGGRHQHSQAARTAIQRPIPDDAGPQVTEVVLSNSITPASGSMSVGATGVAPSISGFYSHSNYAVCVVSLSDFAAGAAAVALGTPTLSGCGVTWAVVGGPYTGSATVAFGGGTLYGAIIVFAGAGTCDDGTLTFGLGTTLTRATNYVIDIVDFANFASVVRTDDDFPGGAGNMASATFAAPFPTGNGAFGLAFDIGVAGSDPSWSASDPSAFRSGGSTVGFVQFHAGLDTLRGGNRLGPSAGVFTYPFTADSNGVNGVWIAELAPTLAPT